MKVLLWFLYTVVSLASISKKALECLHLSPVSPCLWEHLCHTRDSVCSRVCLVLVSAHQFDTPWNLGLSYGEFVPSASSSKGSLIVRRVDKFNNLLASPFPALTIEMILVLQKVPMRMKINCYICEN